MLIYMMVLHFVADFILQSREMGQKKSSELSWLGKHLAIQFGIFFIGLIWFTEEAFLFAGLNTILHGVIDWYIWKGYKWSVAGWLKANPEHEVTKTYVTTGVYEYWKDHWFYSTIGLDQLLHVSTIIGLWMFLCT